MLPVGANCPARPDTGAPLMTGAWIGEGISLTLIVLPPARRNVLSRLRTGKKSSMPPSGVTQKSTTFAGLSNRKSTRRSLMAVIPSPKCAISPCTFCSTCAPAMAGAANASVANQSDRPVMIIPGLGDTRSAERGVIRRPMGRARVDERLGDAAHEILERQVREIHQPESPHDVAGRRRRIRNNEQPVSRRIGRRAALLELGDVVPRRHPHARLAGIGANRTRLAADRAHRGVGSRR